MHVHYAHSIYYILYSIIMFYAIFEIHFTVKVNFIITRIKQIYYIERIACRIMLIKTFKFYLRTFQNTYP